MEKTLILLKPDCLTAGHCGEVITRFEKAGFKILGMKMMHLSSALLKEHYAHLTDKPFYPSIEQFMQRSPVIAMALEGENAIAKIRDMAGPTDSKKAAKGTIRGDFGKDVQENILHASDSAETAKAELKRFFAEGEIFGSTQKVSCCCCG
ncbi:MAG: nucleoside-diphosphate kinase [Verrucomicrobiota bacterium]